MRKFIITSDRFTGRVVFGYHPESNMLVFYSNESEMLPEQHKYVLKYLPLTPEEVHFLAKQVKGVVSELAPDTSFDAFWNTYGKKINKLRALPLYNKLSGDDRLLAIARIRPYKMYCADHKRGVVDPERYLRERYFDTDWRSI